MPMKSIQPTAMCYFHVCKASFQLCSFPSPHVIDRVWTAEMIYESGNRTRREWLTFICVCSLGQVTIAVLFCVHCALSVVSRYYLYSSSV